MDATKQLAQAILAAMEKRESSYDKEAAKKARSVAEEERLADPDNSYAGLVDYKQFYRLTLADACQEIGGELAFPVYLLLVHAWNDAHDWAVEQTV